MCDVNTFTLNQHPSSMSVYVQYECVCGLTACVCFQHDHNEQVGQEALQVLDFGVISLSAYM